MQLRQPQHCPVTQLQHCPLSGHSQDLQRAPRPRGRQIPRGSQENKKNGACTEKQIPTGSLCRSQGVVGVR